MTLSFSLRLRLETGARLGPGKIRLLELIAENGSISAAGRQMRMSYRRAWLLVESLNQEFGTVVTTQKGGSAGGGTRLTDLGTALINHYRSMEKKASEAAADDIRLLDKLSTRATRTQPRKR